jgi:2'-5' RNA ligase
MDLDRGVALRVASEALEEIREVLADQFHGLLTAQDLGPWTPHVTIQNKVDPRTARKLLHAMRANFEPRTVEVAGLQLILYSEGKWGPLATWRFR